MTTTPAQLAQYCANHFPQVTHLTGVKPMHAVIVSVVSLVIGACIGWYVKGRGWFGVKVDAGNALTKVETVGTEVKTEIAAVV